MMTAKGLLAIASAIFAGGAAVFWFMSARVDLPVIGSAWGTISNLEPFYAAIKQVATLNRWAAACAGVSAVLQAVVFCL